MRSRPTRRLNNGYSIVLLDIMGAHATGLPVRVLAIAGTAIVLTLNMVLLLQTFGVNVGL